MEKLQHTTEKLAYTRFPLQQQAKMTAHVQSKLAEYHIEKPEQLIRSMEEYMTWLSIKPVERKGKIYPGNAFSEIMTVIESYGDLHGFSNDMNAVLPAMDTSLPRKIDVLPSPIMWRNVNLVNKILGNTARVPGYVIHKFGLSTLGELVIGAVSVQASKTGFQSYMEAGDFWSYAV